MADGDVAGGLGWPVPADTSDKRLGAQWIRKTLDRIASHIISGGHAWSTISAKPTTSPWDANNISSDSVDGSAPGASTVQTDVEVTWGVARNAIAGLMTSEVYNRTITGTRRGLWALDSGPIGYAPSTRASKQDIVPVEWTLEQIRAIPRIHYRYIVEVEKEGTINGYRAATEVGTLADDLHALGLWEFVIYEGRGDDATPAGVHPELLGLAAIHAVDLLAVRVEAIEERLTKAGL